MKKEFKEILKSFQSDYNRTLEEAFAQTFSENEKVRLFFINENQAFTDGRNIVVDPASDELFSDRPALDRTAAYLGWPPVVLADPWNALRIITRAQTIHECLHIIYSDFPGGQAHDPKCSTINKKRIMALISNIIEDAYIEAVGCSVYDNLELYLRFGRISRLFVSHPSEGTIIRALENMSDTQEPVSIATVSDLPTEKTEIEVLTDYLEYMVDFLLYPMVILEEPPEWIKQYVDATRQLFLEGSTAPSPEERYGYCSRIFDVIAHLIPEDNQPLDVKHIEILLGGCKTFNGDGSLGVEPHKGKSESVTVRLFTYLDGKAKENRVPTAQLMKALREFAKDKSSAQQITAYQGAFLTLKGNDYDCSVLHSDIVIHENHPKINYNFRLAYQNIYHQYKVNISSYNRKFRQLLHASVPQREEKRLYGGGITSKYLGDPKKRYWYQTIAGEDLPDLAVMLLIDGSGSMYGERQKAAMHSAVILHEVLKAQEITHAVVEHRASNFPEIHVNILISFNGRTEERLNLMQLDAYGENRDGLALYWAERYMLKNTHNEHRIIIVLSDGLPAHGADNYYPPVSTKDTAEAVRKISRRGTDIIGIALDQPGSFGCYDQLSQIYPHLIGCNDLTRLTGQMLGVVAKLL